MQFLSGALTQPCSWRCCRRVRALARAGSRARPTQTRVYVDSAGNCKINKCYRKTLILGKPPRKSDVGYWGRSLAPYR